MDQEVLWTYGIFIFLNKISSLTIRLFMQAKSTRVVKKLPSFMTGLLERTELLERFSSTKIVIQMIVALVHGMQVLAKHLLIQC